MFGPGPLFLFIFIVVPLTCAWIAKAHWTHERYMKALQLRAEANARLLDRFGSDPSFLEFLKSNDHRGFFDVSVVDSSRPWPIMRMLTAIQVGVVLLCSGAGFFWIKRWVPSENGPAVLGALAVALGIGSFLSAVAAFAVGRVWGHESGGTRATSRPFDGH